MDPSFNDFEDEVRAPDEVKRERLIEDNRSEFDKQMDEALFLSLQEIKNVEEVNKQYEELIIKNYNYEIISRKEKFQQLLLDMNKFLVIIFKFNFFCF